MAAIVLVCATQSLAAYDRGLTRKIGEGVYTFTLSGANYSMEATLA